MAQIHGNQKRLLTKAFELKKTLNIPDKKPIELSKDLKQFISIEKLESKVN